MKSHERADMLASIHESMSVGSLPARTVRDLIDPELLAMISVIRCVDRALVPRENEFLPLEDDVDDSTVSDWSPSIEREPIQVGRFETIRLLGYGGCGIVFQAFDTQLRRMVALKFPRDDQLGLSSCRSDFLREAQAAAVLDHPLIVPIYEMGEFGKTVYLVAGHVEGIDLASWLHQHGDELSIASVCDFTRILADAVEYMNSKGILHCDLKPGNILMVEERGPYSTRIGDRHWSPRVTDFGLARSLNSNVELAAPSSSRATRAYMAPEQASGQSMPLCRSTDVYLLGAILYELLRRVPQFVGLNPPDFAEFAATDVIAHDMHDSVACHMAAIVNKCVAQRSESRFRSAAEVAAQLEKVLERCSHRSSRNSFSSLLANCVNDHRQLKGAVIAISIATPFFMLWNVILIIFLR